MIRHRVYITFWAYNVKSNTMRRLTGALDGYDLLINANEPELIKIGNIVYKAQLDSSPLKWSSGNVYIKLANVQVQYFAHKVSPRFGTIWRPPDETWGELLGRYMNSCNRVLDAFERLMIEVVITASAKDIATGTDDFSYLHTYDDCMYGAGECPELLPMENETPIFGGFVDLSTISYDEQEQTFEFQVLGYDKWVDLIKTNRVLVSQYSDLYSILDAIAENIPWLKISTVAYQDPLPFRCQFLKLGCTHWTAACTSFNLTEQRTQRELTASGHSMELLLGLLHQRSEESLAIDLLAVQQLSVILRNFLHQCLLV